MGQQIQTEDPKFMRDVHSKALLNTDYHALQQHRRERVYFQNQQNDINILRTQVAELTSVTEEMLEIKTLLKEFITNKES
tara:strand:+ start:2796 stop:3035 length:240 start_codon:yes stop_codon:yes gene_type:complete